MTTTTTTYIVKVHPYFYELQPRLEVHIVDPTGEILNKTIITSVMSTHTLASSLKNHLHKAGYRRTGKFTRVSTDGWAQAKIEYLDSIIIKDSEVERLGVL